LNYSQLTLFLSALDFSIFTTALPTIAHALSSSAGFTWIGAAYLLTSAASSPIWAKASDIWSRKPVLLSAIVIFAASSAICAASKNLAMMVAGRAMQGFGAGGIIVLVNVCISDLFVLRFGHSMNSVACF
jgi:MFS family permease